MILNVFELSFPMHVDLLGRRLVPHNLMSKLLEPCSYTTVPDCPRLKLLTYSGSKKNEPRKGASERSQGVNSHKSRAEFASLLHTYIRDCRSTPLCRDVF